MNKTIPTLVSLLFLSLISFAQKNVSDPVAKELETAEAKMFDAVPKFDAGYWKNTVHADYITINADGVMQNKEAAFADSARKNMFVGVTSKLFDKVIRHYGNVGIITGRAQFFMGERMIVEVFYTEIWLKENGKWLFDGWQGTMTKDSPKPPAPPQN